jgi:hypothetical protein
MWLPWCATNAHAARMLALARASPTRLRVRLLMQADHAQVAWLADSDSDLTSAQSKYSSLRTTAVVSRRARPRRATLSRVGGDGGRGGAGAPGSTRLCMISVPPPVQARWQRVVG